jgi:hypothetical protein
MAERKKQRKYKQEGGYVQSADRLQPVDQQIELLTADVTDDAGHIIVGDAGPNTRYVVDNKGDE